VASTSTAAATPPGDPADLGAALTARLRALLDDGAGIEVVTSAGEGAAQKRAVTRILPNGDLHTSMPGAPCDEATLAHHARMVHEAASDRSRLIDALSSALARLRGPSS
jgi:hypothetical protein